VADKIGAVLIAGPTASGKSGLALALAERHGGAIVNADSMQVYGDLRVLTARPSEADERQTPHRLYGHVDAAVNYSVGHYLRDAAEALTRLRQEGALPIVVGGTGLYFRALIEGLSHVPAVPAEVREAVRDAAGGRDTPSLHAELAARDPATAASLKPTDRQRVLRALEVLTATGRPLVSFHGPREPGPLAGVATVRILLSPDREALRQRIDARLDAMMAAGALDEVRALASRGLDPQLPLMRAYGVPPLMRHIAGEIGLEAAVAEAQAGTRQYAKRQLTWFRHQMPGWTWVLPEEAETFLRDQLGVSAPPPGRADRK
jgi:tRNA dimethylallyltransferase